MTSLSFAQWHPAGRLIDVKVINTCKMPDRQVAFLTPDGIFFCPERAADVDAQMSSASHFYLVHEYGRVAINTPSRKLADCWAARALAAAPNGPFYVKQWIKHWLIHGTSDPTYGTPEQRTSYVRSCCACGA